MDRRRAGWSSVVDTGGSRCQRSTSCISSRDPGTADVTLVEEDAVDDVFDCLIDRHVVEYDTGGLAVSSE